MKRACKEKFYKLLHLYSIGLLFCSLRYIFPVYTIQKTKTYIPLFQQFVDNFPEAKGKLFALAYLYKLSKESERDNLVKKVRKEIITFKQQSFLFRVFKNYQYRSPLYLSHKAVYYIDRVEFYIDDQLFAEIPF